MAQASCRTIPSKLEVQQYCGGTAVQSPTIIVSPEGNASLKTYKRTLRGIGYAEVFLGIILCVLGIVVVSTTYTPYSIGLSGQGIWCGVFLFVSGIMGIKVRGNPTRCMYIANMVHGILTSCAMGVLIIISSVAATFNYGSVAIIHWVTAVLGFAGMVISIVQSAYCCAGVCCKPHMMICAPSQQLIQTQSGQLMVVPLQGVQEVPHCSHSSTVVVSSQPADVPLEHKSGLQSDQNQVLVPSPSKPSYTEY